VIELRNDDGPRLGIAAVALVVLLTSIAFSKRKAAVLGASAAETEAAAV
jgi:hypothetical protein